MFEFEQSGRRSTTSSVGGHGQIQDELRYTTEPDEAGIESPAIRDLQYATLMTQEQQMPQQQQQVVIFEALCSQSVRAFVHVSRTNVVSKIFVDKI